MEDETTASTIIISKHAEKNKTNVLSFFLA